MSWIWIVALGVVLTVILVYFMGGKDAIQEKVSKHEISELIVTGDVDDQKEVVQDWIDDGIDDKNPYRQIETVAVLEEIGGDDSIDIIEEGLNDDTPSVIIASIQTLARMKSTQSIAALSDLYSASETRTDGYGEGIRVTVLDALGEIGDEQSLSLLHGVLNEEEGSFIYKAHAVDAIAKVKSEASLNALTVFRENLMENRPSNEWREMEFLWEDLVKRVDDAIQKIEL